MKTIILTIPAMSCGHCVSAIEGGLAESSGIKSADVNLELKSVEVVYDENLITKTQIIEAIDEIGYEVA
ncbi:MAG: copper ion binding protein [Culicoidibacterales bacterium]